MADFELQVIEVLLLARSRSQAARHLEFNWHQVHAVQAAAVRRGLSRRDTEDIGRVGLHKKSFGRRHHYGTVLSDLDHRRVLEVVEHRAQVSAKQALHALPQEQVAKIKVVALEMRPAFMGAATVTVPQAELVHDIHDRFHVMKHLNEDVDKVRKEERGELSDSSRDSQTDRKVPKVTKACGLRETLQSFWKSFPETSASAFVSQSWQNARESGLRLITRVTIIRNYNLKVNSNTSPTA